MADADKIVDAEKSTIATDTQKLNDIDKKAIITINLKDKDGNALAGKKISLLVDGKVPANDSYTLSEAIAGAAGEYKAVFSAKAAAPDKTYTIAAKGDNITLKGSVSIQVALAPPKPLLSKGIALTGRSTHLACKYYLRASIDDIRGNVGVLPEGAIVLEAYVYCDEAFTNSLSLAFGDNYQAKITPKLGLNSVTLPSMPSVSRFNNAHVTYNNTTGKGHIIVTYVGNS